MPIETRPRDIAIERSSGCMHVVWQDGHSSRFELAWLRMHCPCATCREERREQAAHRDPLRLVATPPPSQEIVAAEFVGHYAIRFTWGDGHTAGIFPFEALRASCPCQKCNPGGAIQLMVGIQE